MFYPNERTPSFIFKDNILETSFYSYSYLFDSYCPYGKQGNLNKKL